MTLLYIRGFKIRRDFNAVHDEHAKVQIDTKRGRNSGFVKYLLRGVISFSILFIYNGRASALLV